MNKEHNIQSLVCGSIGSAISFTGCSAASLESIDHIFSIICGVLGILITITTCIIIPVIRKIRAAKSDGHIDKDELDDIAATLEDGFDKLKDQLDDQHKKK